MLELQIQSLIPEEGKILWVVDEAEGVSKNLLQTFINRSCILSNRFDILQSYRDPNLETVLSDFCLPAGSKYKTIIFPISKEKLLCHHVLFHSAEWLEDSGTLVVFGKKNQGIKSLFDKLATNHQLKKINDNYLGTTNKIKLQNAQPEFESNYTESNVIGRFFSPQNQGDKVYTLNSKPGIFSWKKLDQGSLFLSETLAGNSISFSEKQILDLACGSGHLAVFAASLGAKKIDASDNNITAVNACKQNFARNNIAGEVTCDDAGSNIQTRYDLILCNPPFHKGKQTDYGLTLKFAEAAQRLLKPSGEAWFVCNAFIPIERQAKPLFKHVDLVANNQQFKVLRLRKI